MAFFAVFLLRYQPVGFSSKPPFPPAGRKPPSLSAAPDSPTVRVAVGTLSAFSVPGLHRQILDASTVQKTVLGTPKSTLLISHVRDLLSAKVSASSQLAWSHAVHFLSPCEVPFLTGGLVNAECKSIIDQQTAKASTSRVAEALQRCTSLISPPCSAAPRANSQPASPPAIITPSFVNNPSSHQVVGQFCCP